jgi:hypothetical protein
LRIAGSAGLLFLQVGSDRSHRIIALDPRLGEPVWEFPEVGTAFAVGDSVFVAGFGAGVNTWMLYSLNAETGAPQWSIALDWDTYYWAVAGMAVTDESVYLLINGINVSAITSVNSVDGSTNWIHEFEGSGVGVAIAGSTVFVAAVSNTLWIDSKTGVTLWETSTGDGSQSVRLYSIVIAGDTILGLCGAVEDYDLCQLKGVSAQEIPLEAGIQAETVIDSVPLKGAPSSSAVEREVLAVGTIVAISSDAVVADGVTWWPVEVSETGRQGWIEEQYLKAYFPE